MSEPKSISKSVFKVFGVDVVCHVLDNGQRVIEADSMTNLILGMKDKEALNNIGEIENLAKWQTGK